MVSVVDGAVLSPAGVVIASVPFTAVETRSQFYVHLYSSCMANLQNLQSHHPDLLRNTRNDSSSTSTLRVERLL